MKQIRVICALAVLLGLCVFPAAAAGKDGVKPSFSLVIKEGWGSIGVGHMNNMLNQREAFLQALNDRNSGTSSGSIRALDKSYSDAEAELRMNLGRLSLGLALTAPARISGPSDKTISWTDAEETTTMREIWAPEIRTDRPVQLTLYYSQPIVSRVRAVAGAGIGYYRAEMKMRRAWEYIYSPYSALSGDYRFDVRGHCFGPHIGLGLECAVMKSVSVILEGQWRSVRIKRLSGTSTMIANQFGSSGYAETHVDTYEGDLIYYFRVAEGDTLVQAIMCLEPEYMQNGWDSYSDPYKAGLDLSGFSFKIGLKINLF